MADVRYVDHEDGRRDIIVRPDPVLLEVRCARGKSEGAFRRQFRHHGSLVDLVVGLKAMGVERIVLAPDKRLQLERELKERGLWDAWKDALLDT